MKSETVENKTKLIWKWLFPTWRTQSQWWNCWRRSLFWKYIFLLIIFHNHCFDGCRLSTIGPTMEWSWSLNSWIFLCNLAKLFFQIFLLFPIPVHHPNLNVIEQLFLVVFFVFCLYYVFCFFAFLLCSPIPVPVFHLNEQLLRFAQGHIVPVGQSNPVVLKFLNFLKLFKT